MTGGGGSRTMFAVVGTGPVLGERFREGAGGAHSWDSNRLAFFCPAIFSSVGVAGDICSGSDSDPVASK
jgi:hypothetical protein